MCHNKEMDLLKRRCETVQSMNYPNKKCYWLKYMKSYRRFDNYKFFCITEVQMYRWQTLLWLDNSKIIHFYFFTLLWILYYKNTGIQMAKFVHNVFSATSSPFGSIYQDGGFLPRAIGPPCKTNNSLSRTVQPI